MVKIFADGADLRSILELNNNPLIQGFTTNPSLLKKSGITNYEEFILSVVNNIKDKPISFEVISDDLEEMLKQAYKLASYGDNIYVKIPITNTKGKSTFNIVKKLSDNQIKVNVTALTTMKQVREIASALSYKSCISIFAGRIADTGKNPMSIILDSVEYLYGSNIEIIWASPREVYNITQAGIVNCHIITCTPDLIKKYELLKDKDLTEYSRETVQMFYSDAISSGLTL